MRLETKELLKLRVAGKPAAQPRVKTRTIATRHGKRVKVDKNRPGKVDRVYSMVYTPESAKEWKDTVWATVKEARVGGLDPCFDPVVVTATFVLPRPKYMSAKKYGAGRVPHGKKPDVDNLAKALYDALSMAAVWHDDAQIVTEWTGKWYAAIGEAPGCELSIDVVTGWK